MRIKSSILKSPKSPNSSGIVEVRKLSPKFNFCKLCNVDNEDGNDPSITLPDKSNSINPSRAESSDGIVPEISLLVKLSLVISALESYVTAESLLPTHSTLDTSKMMKP